MLAEKADTAGREPEKTPCQWRASGQRANSVVHEAAKQDAALHAAAILMLPVARLREAWPGARILCRE